MTDDDDETAQTVTFMDELSAIDSNDPAVEDATTEALELAGLDRYADPMQKAQAVFWWLKKRIRYVPTPGTSPLVDQTLITPLAVLAMPEPIGDCPQFSMLASAMFRVLCMDSRFVTIKADQRDPRIWSHVYNTVEVGPGQYMPFDSSNGPAPGAEYAKPYQRRVWPRLTPGKCRTKERTSDMLRTFAGPRRGMRNATLRGDYEDFNIDTYGQYGGDYSTGGGSGWSQTLQDVINAGIQIGVPFAQKQLGTQQRPASPYFVSNAAGQSVLYDPNTGRVASGSNIASAINPQYLTWGIAAIAGIALLSVVKSK